MKLIRGSTPKTLVPTAEPETKREIGPVVGVSVVPDTAPVLSPEAVKMEAAPLKEVSNEAATPVGGTTKIGRWVVDSKSNETVIRPEGEGETTQSTKDSTYLWMGEGRGRVMVIVMRAPEAVEEPMAEKMSLITENPQTDGERDEQS